jgi:serine/threonine-protein kinase HipA
MDTSVLVSIDLDGKPTLVGRLFARTRKSKESASFEYDKSWLVHPDRFALDPGLSLDPGPFHTDPKKSLFGVFGDSAPDRWGRVLMRRAERMRAKYAQETPRTLMEIDYLLQVDDEAREGALRFSLEPEGPFLAANQGRRIPLLIELPRLLSAATHVAADLESEDDLRLLLAPGSSLGGARPKSSVRDRDGSLSIAKFPRDDDEVKTVLWEAVALGLAEKAGIDVPDWRLAKWVKKAF